MVDLLDVVRDMVGIRHVLARSMLAVSAILVAGRSRTQGSLPPGPRCGGIVNPSRVGRDMYCDARPVVRTGKPGHGGCGAGQPEQAEAKEVGELHSEWRQVHRRVGDQGCVHCNPEDMFRCQG